MRFFDFVAALPQYQGIPDAATRLNRRYEHIVLPFAAEIAGRRVLDLAAHDGRWSYAFAAAGAAEVHGVEVRPELIARFAAYPDAALRARVHLHCADLFDWLETAAARGERFDVVAVFGILYHVLDHHRLFLLLRRLAPRLILVDGEFLLREAPLIALIRERTDMALNAAPAFPGQQVAVKGVPSPAALEVIAETLGYRTDWIDWQALPPAERTGVQDYFRDARMRRASCALRPVAGGSGMP